MAGAISSHRVENGATAAPRRVNRVIVAGRGIGGMRGESSIATNSLERTVQKLHQQKDVAHNPSKWVKLHRSGQKEKARGVESLVKGIVSRIREDTTSGSKSNASDSPCWRRWRRQNKKWVQGIWRRF